MSSWNESGTHNIRSLGRLVDQQATTPGFTQTVGFGVASSTTEPITISRPSLAPGSPERLSSSFGNVTRSQLTGWSDTIPLTSPKSADFMEGYLSGPSAPQLHSAPGPGIHKPPRPGSLSSLVGPSISVTDSSQKTNQPAPKGQQQPGQKGQQQQGQKGQSQQQQQKKGQQQPQQQQKGQQQQQKGPQKAADPNAPDLSKMTKEERAAYYASQGFNGAKGGSAATKVKAKKMGGAGGKNEKAEQAGGETNTPATTATSGATNKSRTSSTVHKPVMQFDDGKKRAKAEKKKVLHLQPSAKQVALFAHLPQYENLSSLKLGIGFSAGQLPPVWLELGLKYAKGVIMGSNARCVAMLEAFKQVFREFKSPSGVLSRDFDIKKMIQFLVDCRPLSVSMGNAINHIKMKISETTAMSTVGQAVEYLCESIDKFIQERITAADEIISNLGADRIEDGDVILTHAKSYSVEMILKKAFYQGKKFRVIVVDSRPRKEGECLLQNLLKAGMECTYIYINALSYIMPEVTKIFVGAHAMTANGSLVSRVGTAAVAVAAKTYQVPFMVCCETYKFTERVQIESISSNELADPDDLLQPIQSGGEKSILADWKNIPNLKLLNLAYDTTPAEFIIAVITEVGIIPPTSVAVALRIIYTLD
ncbi:eIF2B GDP-GTP exchange factor [Planoprotostelium fungivorum]|uniref:Translation initiation factor eIF2B subunit delta n=1 Tax=Planoprotostelium fungivorum TaxID=1890364 RepID=A0A2P6MWR1_9EUKA|nr:eIF2B GDP-GTP exchange factor [Planoprotostelium fungivorum]